MKDAVKILISTVFLGSLFILFSHIAILICMGESSVSHEAAYNITISKKSGSIIAESHNGTTIASGVSNLDDTSVIQKTFDSINDEGIIYFDNSKYNVSRTITSNGKNIEIQGKDTEFNINTGSDAPGFYFSGELIRITPFLDDVDKGNNIVSLKDASGTNEGDLIRVYNDKLWCPDDYSTHKTGEMYIVEGVSGNNLKLNSNLLRDYTNKLNSEARIYKPVTIKIDGCTFLGTGSKEEVRGVLLEFCNNSKISNCYFDNNGMAALSLYTCYGVDVSKNVILNSNMPGYGYGVGIANACTDITIQDNYIQTCRHCITSGCSDDYGENRDIYISNNNLHNGIGIGSVIDSHPTTINYEVVNNKIYCGSDSAFDDGTAYSIFANNEVYEAYGEDGKSAISIRGQVANSRKIITGNYVECAYLIYGANKNISEITVSNNNIISKKTADVILLVHMNIRKFVITNNSITSGRSWINITESNIENISISENTIKNIKNPPVAEFTANVTSGTAPLTVLFADTSIGEAPTSWYWDFGDGINSKDSIAVHMFTKPGNYTISLTVENITFVGNSITTKSGYIVVTNPNAPVADFNSNVTEGYAPLTVQFTDLSQKTTSRMWDFNSDGQTDSSDISPVYVYANDGTYTVNLTVSNENGTASKTATINVLTPSGSNGDSSSGGSSHSSSSGGGGVAGGSPEPQTNVQVKELSQAFITNGKTVKFEFTKNATCVVYVSFDAKKTFGKTTIIAEQLKGKSSLVSGLPEGEVYKSFNVWVGNGGIATSKNIENPVVCFKVEKSWVKDKNIDKFSITLNRCNNKKWDQFPVSLSGEDNNFLYFTAKTSGFSSFVITGTEKPSEEIVKEVQVETPNTPSFEIYYGIAGLLAVFLYKRK